MSEERLPLKDVEFNYKHVSIVMQNQNGPCPIIALANALILNGDIQLSSREISSTLGEGKSVNFGGLAGILAEHLLARTDPNPTDSVTGRVDHRPVDHSQQSQNQNDHNHGNQSQEGAGSEEKAAFPGLPSSELDLVLQLIPKLEKGLDVNVYFERCDAFEFTPALSLFDIARVKVPSIMSFTIINFR